ncbi:MAG: O-antigen ligase family protein [Bacteroidales bacterium]|nr:O-antigen ligase family protein [Candidatus Colimorpha onthohippi]
MKQSMQKILAQLKKHNLLCVAGIVLLLASVVVTSHTLDKTNIIRYVVWAIGLLVLVGMVLVQKPSHSLRLSWGDVALLLFVALQWCSVAWATNVQEALFEASRWTLAAVTLLVFESLFRRSPARVILLLARVSVVVSLIALGVAIVQSIQGGSWLDRYYIVSLFVHKGVFSMMLLLLLMFPILLLRLRLSRHRWLYCVVVLFNSIAIVYLQSRSVWIAALAIVASYVLFACHKLWHRKRGRLLLFGCYVVASVAVVVGCGWFVRLSLSSPNQSSGILANTTILERQKLWGMTFDMISHRPLLGCGVGNWKVCCGEASTKEVFSMDVLNFKFVRPHNDWLRIISEVGYVGFALLVVAFGLLIATADGSSSGRSLRRRQITNCAASFLVGVLIYGLFDFPIDRTELLLWSVIVVACVGGMTDNGWQMQRRGWVAVGVLLLAIVGVGSCRLHSEYQLCEASRCFQLKKWRQADIRLSKSTSFVCSLTSEGDPIAYYQGMARTFQNKPALDCFLQAEQASPWHKFTLCELGRLQYNQCHDADKAIQYLQRCIYVSPSQLLPYIYLAEVYQSKHQYDDAINVLKSFDLKGKQQAIDIMTWHYLEGPAAEYYTHQVIPADSIAIQTAMANCLDAASRYVQVLQSCLNSSLP